MQKTFLTLMVGVFLLLGTVISVADEKTVTTVTTNTVTTTAAPAMSPEEQVMMGRMKEYTTPNENHKVLESLAGKWNTTAKFWMKPGGEPEVSSGTSDARMIFGGRFLEQNFTGTVMGQPFEGRGIYGYDNMRKEYTGIWFDNMATGIMSSVGKYDPATKTLSDEGSMSCPITNETHRSYRSVTKIIDANHYTYETYMKDEKGQEFRSMEITYTRA
jgi:hypothetical protein